MIDVDKLQGRKDLQVATGVHKETGEVVVILRLGAIVAAMSPEAADHLGDSLKIEAVLATTRRDAPIS